MKEISLSDRMEAVVGLMPPGMETVADVGCDHAYVSIALIRRGLAKHVIAMDVRKGPLQIASKNVTECGLNEQIELRLGDGLERLRQGEADAIILAGMGGLLMCGILQRGYGILQEAPDRPELILQPQSDIRQVRRYLSELGYEIVQEVMLSEEGKYYTAMRATARNTSPEEVAKEEWLRYGRKLLEQRDPVLHAYLRREQLQLEKIEKHLSELMKEAAVSEKTRLRYEQIRQEQLWNACALQYYAEEV